MVSEGKGQKLILMLKAFYDALEDFLGGINDSSLPVGHFLLIFLNRDLLVPRSGPVSRYPGPDQARSRNSCGTGGLGEDCSGWTGIAARSSQGHGHIGHRGRQLAAHGVRSDRPQGNE